MQKLKINKILLEIKQFIKAKWLHVTVFFAINVVIGSLGVWLAVVIAASNDQKTAFDELIKSFDSGGPYTFAVAYLAAATAYLVKEYQEKIDTDFRMYKTFFGVLAVLLIIICSVLAAAQTQNSESSPSNKLFKASFNYSQNSSISPSNVQEVSVSGNQEQEAKAHSNSKFKNSHWIQFWLTVMAIFIGIILYLLERAGDTDQKDSLGFIRDNRKKGIEVGEEYIPLIDDAKFNDIKL